MTQTTREENDTAREKVLYMALELSQSKWQIAYGNGIKERQITIESNDTRRLEEEVRKAKVKLGLAEEAEVISCYEAGRDGFWIHRYLEKVGIKNYVIDSSSIKIDRRARRAKTDRLDAQKLLKQLILHSRGEEKLQIARVPSEVEEDRRRMHRERERLKKERTSHTNRIRSLLNLVGIKCKGKKVWENYLELVRDWKGETLPPHKKEELLRESKRLDLLEKQIKELETKMSERLKTNNEESYEKIKQLMSLKGVGDVSSWVLMMEWFGWRKFNNRREVGSAAGLVGAPYSSGESHREQGITKSGNSRIRALMVELSWSWLRYQPNSKLARWFNERFNHGKRSRKIGIVALARKLLIALWRYVTTGELPEGAELKASKAIC